MAMTKRDAYITLVASGMSSYNASETVDEAWVRYPDKVKPAPKFGTKESLAKALKKAIGCSINPARNQIAALQAIPYWTNERIMDAIKTAQPGEAPWDWTKRVRQEAATHNTGPNVVSEFEKKAKEQAERVARGD